MRVQEIRDAEAAMQYVCEGLWLTRVVQPPLDKKTFETVMQWGLGLVANGAPLPPLNFVVDVGLLANGHLWVSRQPMSLSLSARDASLLQAYENRFVARVPLDFGFKRATQAILRYPLAERPRATAFLLRQMAQHLRLGGAYLSLEFLRQLQQLDKLDFQQLWDQYQPQQISTFMIDLHKDLMRILWRTHTIVAEEDVTALEDRSALGGRAQFVAMRQIHNMIRALEPYLLMPPSRLKQPPSGWLTRVFFDDHYPLGGYASLTTRGSLESLLHTQLAYMEEEKPDLFELKYLNNELMYYSRDENRIIRQRKIIVFLFDSEISQLRFKDRELPYERIIIVLACIVLAIRRLTDWLSDEALHFEIRRLEVTTDKPIEAVEGQPSLSFPPIESTADTWEEWRWLELLLRRERERGAATVGTWKTFADAYQALQQWSQQANVYCLRIASQFVRLNFPSYVKSAALLVNGPYPRVTIVDQRLDVEENHPIDSWGQILIRLIELWIS